MPEHSVGRIVALTDAQLTLLSPYGEERPTAVGQILFRQGDPQFDFFVILEGGVEIVSDAHGAERVLAVFSRGCFTGELNMLTGQSALATARVRDPGTVLVIAPGRLHEIMACHTDLGDTILATFLERRAMMLDVGRSDVRILGSRFSPATHRLREFAERSRLPHEWIDLESDESADALLTHFGIATSETPVVICHGNRVLKNPTVSDVARCLGLDARSRAERDRTYDVIVVGAGPAGLSASVYAASEGLATLTVDASGVGGQAGTSSRIENYLGFPMGISGADLAERAMAQAIKFGARLALSSEVGELTSDADAYQLKMSDGTVASGRTIIVATGARYRRLELPRLRDFEGNGVYYAAAETEAQLCAMDDVVIVGGGNSAGQAAIFLAGRVAQVHLIVRAGGLGHSMSRYLVDRIVKTPNIRVMLNATVCDMAGEERLTSVRVRDETAGETEEIRTHHLFSFVGAEANTRWLGGAVALDRNGFVLTGNDLSTPVSHRRAPHMFETSLPGVFAVGDVRSASIKRVASAVGEGSMAVKVVHDFLAGR